MFFFKQLNKNYFIYFILIFVFIPLNYIPQLFDGVYIDYALETGNVKTVDFWYKDASRYVHFFIIYFINILSKKILQLKRIIIKKNWSIYSQASGSPN